jgi:hypothetical protein
MSDNLIKRIQQLAKKYNISAYDIGKNTKITITTARNILTDSDHKNRPSTVRIVLEYLESFENQNKEKKVEEREMESLVNLNYNGTEIPNPVLVQYIYDNWTNLMKQRLFKAKFNEMATLYAYKLAEENRD